MDNSNVSTFFEKMKKGRSFPSFCCEAGITLLQPLCKGSAERMTADFLVLGGHGAPAQLGDSYRLSCLEILGYPDLLFGSNGENKSLFGVGARKTRMLGLMTTCARKLGEFRSDFDQCAVMPLQIRGAFIFPTEKKAA